MKGNRLECDLITYLKGLYPMEKFTHTYKGIYDIYNDKVYIDNVSVDQQNRLIVDHKNYCHEHRVEAHRDWVEGYISFLWQGTYYFLSVDSRILKTKIRPQVTGHLLSACKKHILPLPKSTLSDSELIELEQRKQIYDAYLKRMEEKRIANPPTQNNVRMVKRTLYSRDKKGNVRSRVAYVYEQDNTL